MSRRSSLPFWPEALKGRYHRLLRLALITGVFSIILL